MVYYLMEKSKKISKKEIIVREESTYLSYEIKTLITIFLLVSAYPVGLVLMFKWMKWPGWVKFLVFLPIILGLLGLVVFMAAMGLMVGKAAIDNQSYEDSFGEARTESTEVRLSPTVVAKPTFRVVK